MENLVVAETENWAIAKNERYDSFEVCYKPKLRKTESKIAGRKVVFEETPMNLYNDSFGAYAFSYSTVDQFKKSFFDKSRKRFEDISSVDEVSVFEVACKNI